MSENEPKKSVKDLVKAFDSNPNAGDAQKAKPKNTTQKEKMPLFPTLKKLPSDVNNKYTEEKTQKDVPKTNDKKKKDLIKNPFSFFWDKSKKNKENDDSKVIEKKKCLKIIKI